MKRTADFFLTIFAVGVLLTLFAGGLSFFGYVAALLIGGEQAVEICGFIYKQYLPWVIKITSVCVGCGLIGMYLSKVKALTITSDEGQK